MFKAFYNIRNSSVFGMAIMILVGLLASIQNAYAQAAANTSDTQCVSACVTLDKRLIAVNGFEVDQSRTYVAQPGAVERYQIRIMWDRSLSAATEDSYYEIPAYAGGSFDDDGFFADVSSTLTVDPESIQVRIGDFLANNVIQLNDAGLPTPDGSTGNLFNPEAIRVPIPYGPFIPQITITYEGTVPENSTDGLHTGTVYVNGLQLFTAPDLFEDYGDLEAAMTVYESSGDPNVDKSILQIYRPDENGEFRPIGPRANVRPGDEILFQVDVDLDGVSANGVGVNYAIPASGFVASTPRPNEFDYADGEGNIRVIEVFTFDPEQGRLVLLEQTVNWLPFAEANGFLSDTAIPITSDGTLGEDLRLTYLVSVLDFPQVEETFWRNSVDIFVQTNSDTPELIGVVGSSLDTPFNPILDFELETVSRGTTDLLTNAGVNTSFDYLVRVNLLDGALAARLGDIFVTPPNGISLFTYDGETAAPVSVVTESMENSFVVNTGQDAPFAGNSLTQVNLTEISGDIQNQSGSALVIRIPAVVTGLPSSTPVISPSMGTASAGALVTDIAATFRNLLADGRVIGATQLAQKSSMLNSGRGSEDNCECIAFTVSADRASANVGDTIGYTLRLEITDETKLNNVGTIDLNPIFDTLPRGVYFIPGSETASWNGQGVPIAIESANRQTLNFFTVDLADDPDGTDINQVFQLDTDDPADDAMAVNGGLPTPDIISNGDVLRLRYKAIVTDAVTPGSIINNAILQFDEDGPGAASQAATILTASARVRVGGEPIFECSEILGQVFHDRNGNGTINPGENGVPGARLINTRGYIITTDQFGRYHIPCAARPRAGIGANYILKLVKSSLPHNFRITSENPRVVRLTRGKSTPLNFGVQLAEATPFTSIRFEVTDSAFAEGSVALKPDMRDNIAELVSVISNQPTSLALVYNGQGDAKARLDALSKVVRQGAASEGNPHPLDISYYDASGALLR